MSDPRFVKINELFINYAKGNFDFKIKTSSNLDEIDAFISNINMLGEELKATTISKNYFNNIFHSVSDIIFIIKKNGEILDLNSAGYKLLKYSPRKPNAINLFHLFQNKNELINFKNQINTIDLVLNMHIKLKDKDGKVFDCMISANKIENEGTEAATYQGIIKDMTKEKEAEHLVIRTIVNTQEKERERFARDLHDSLGQQLSGINFYIETLKKNNLLSGKPESELLTKSRDAIQSAIHDLRNVCFNLMPRTLEYYGLKSAILELTDKIESAGGIKFKISIDKGFPTFIKPLEIAIFRILQEFISNSIKHGKAKEIIIKTKNDGNKLNITLKDNGIGFNYKKLNKFAGMGLQNVRSRVNAYNGEVEIESAVKKGTTYHIRLPIKQNIA